MRRSSLGALSLTLVLCACAQGGGVGLRDAGSPRDAGTPSDAGAPPDAAPPDAAVPPGEDGGPEDGGPPPEDAGPPPPEDAGPSCAGVDCRHLDGPCAVGTCNPATGACVRETLTDGTTCDDGNRCNVAACAGGACLGTPRDCSSLDAVCVVGACDPATGACTTAPRADGIACDTNPNDCSVHACRAGACTPAPSPDCHGCNEGGGTYCTAGTCGPGASTITHGFETGLPGGWTVGGTAGWLVDGARPRSGAMSARSGMIGHSATSSMSASLSFATTIELSFWLTTSTESGYDFLRFFVNGVEQQRWSGATAWTRAAVTLPPGAHTVEWRYTKDGSSSVGDDRVWIDDVAIAVAPPSEGFEGGALPAGWTASGHQGWTVTSAQRRTGTFSARSGAITHSQTSSLTHSSTYASAGAFSFWRRVSSESSFDYLEIYIDGVRRDRWAGSLTTWTQQTYAVDAGAHVFEWRYIKDGSVSSGEDAAYIDDVVATDTVPAVNLCAP
ncbi:MAG: hypothetical protein KF729_34385 [Sandaracinaceae bacterium]|nr:hypothetical protein [Sandaracinaceae bacterium]